MPAALASSSGSSGVAAVRWGGAPAGFSPVKAKPALTCGRWLPSLERPKPSTTGFSAIASAKIWSLSGSWLGSAGSIPATSRTTVRGDSRSGSANRISKAIAAAPMSESRLTSSAIRSLGQGHWPNSLSEASSMSMTRTGKSWKVRGAMRWYSSNVASRISFSGRGSLARRIVSAATMHRPMMTPSCWARVMTAVPDPFPAAKFRPPARRR